MLRRLGPRLGLAIAAGLCLWLSFPTIGLWPLAIVGVALQALALRGVRARTGLLLGLVSGLAYLAPVLHWTGIFVGPFPWLALSVTESLYVAVMGAALAIAQGGTRAAWTRRLPHPHSGRRGDTQRHHE